MMFRYHKWFLLGIGLILIVACNPTQSAFVCEDEIGCVTIAPNEPIKLGVIHDQTGSGARFGIEQIQATELAVEAVDNTLLGHPIELQIEDEGCTAEGGGVSALKLVADPQLLGILGTTCSTAAVEAGRIMTEKGLVLISGANTATALTGIGGKQGADWHEGYFRTMSHASIMGDTGAKFFFEELGKRKAAVINDGDVFSTGQTDVFESSFTALGGEIVLSATIDKGETNMEPVLTAVANSGAELLFFASFPTEGVQIINQLYDVPKLVERADRAPFMVMGIGNVLTDDFVKTLKAEPIELYFALPRNPQGEDVDALAQAIEEKYGQAPTSTNYVHAYNATQLLLAAIENVAVQDPDGTLHIGRQALRHNLYATRNFNGIAGPITCDALGDCGGGIYDVMRFENDDLTADDVRANIIYTYSIQR